MEHTTEHLEFFRDLYEVHLESQAEQKKEIFTADELSWFIDVMDKKIVDVDEEESQIYTFIQHLFIHMSIEGRKLPPELSKIVNRHYPEL